MDRPLTRFNAADTSTTDAPSLTTAASPPPRRRREDIAPRLDKCRRRGAADFSEAESAATKREAHGDGDDDDDDDAAPTETGADSRPAPEALLPGGPPPTGHCLFLLLPPTDVIAYTNSTPRQLGLLDNSSNSSQPRCPGIAGKYQHPEKY